ncbi:MAG: YceI family protein [Candidatus Kapabacteria bacterium]|nr:YceI family protein [Candidatus Kapabacteria bacterium]
MMNHDNGPAVHLTAGPVICHTNNTNAIMSRIMMIIALAMIVGGAMPTSSTLDMVIHIEEGSRLFIEGTSNINSFECLCNDRFNPRNVRVRVDDEQRTIAFTGTTLALKTAQLDCDNSKINKDLCTALKAEEFPTINIALHQATIVGRPVNETDWTDIQASASLTITDQTRKVTLSVKGRKLSDGRYRFVSVKELKMSDFGIEPPTALFGLIKVRDRIKINFDLIVKVV